MNVVIFNITILCSWRGCAVNSLKGRGPSSGEAVIGRTHKLAINPVFFGYSPLRLLARVKDSLLSPLSGAHAVQAHDDVCT